MATPVEVPEHDKVHAVKDRSQAIGNFLVWLQSEKGLVLAEWHWNHQHDDDCTTANGMHTCGLRRGDNELREFQFSPVRLLAEYFGIDLEKVAQEKEALLEAIRGASHVGG